MIQGTPVNIIVGSHVWAEDPEDAWVDGEVIEIKGQNAMITVTNGKTVSFCYFPLNWKPASCIMQSPEIFNSIVLLESDMNLKLSTVLSFSSGFLLMDWQTKLAIKFRI